MRTGADWIEQSSYKTCIQTARLHPPSYPVDVLLAAGIDVLTTMNIQHLESLNDQI
jgi:hypothetical protein